MNVNKCNKRDRKIKKRKYGMIVDGYNTKDIPRIQSKRLEIQKRRKEKEERMKDE